MKRIFDNLASDLNNIYLPKDFESAYSKVKCLLNTGQKVYWYYDEDKQFFEDMGENVLDNLHSLFCGIIIPRPGITSSHDLDIEDAIVIITSYPTEKESPEISWVALRRLIDSEDFCEMLDEEYYEMNRNKDYSIPKQCPTDSLENFKNKSKIE